MNITTENTFYDIKLKAILEKGTNVFFPKNNYLNVKVAVQFAGVKK